MSLVDVLEFTSQPLIKTKLIAPVLLAVFENLIRKTVVHCDSKGFDLLGIEAFDQSLNTWQQQLVLIYKNVYTMDCERTLKVQRANKTQITRGLPDSMIANSKALRSLLEFLASRGDTQLKQSIVEVIEEVHNKVFGHESIGINTPGQTYATEMSKKTRFKTVQGVAYDREAIRSLSKRKLKKRADKYFADSNQDIKKMVMTTPDSHITKTPLGTLSSAKFKRNINNTGQNSFKEFIGETEQLRNSVQEQWNRAEQAKKKAREIEKGRRVQENKRVGSQIFNADGLPEQISSTTLKDRKSNRIKIKSPGVSNSFSESAGQSLRGFTPKARRVSNTSRKATEVAPSFHTSHHSSSDKIGLLPQLNKTNQSQAKNSLFPVGHKLMSATQVINKPEKKNSDQRLPKLTTTRPEQFQLPNQITVKKTLAIQPIAEQRRTIQEIKIFGKVSSTDAISKQESENKDRVSPLLKISTGRISPNDLAENLAAGSSLEAVSPSPARQSDQSKSPVRREIEPPSHFVSFDPSSSNFKFGTIGIYNTKRDNSFYKIVASVGGKTFIFNSPDWNQTTQTIWRFSQSNDQALSGNQIILAPYSCIIYTVMRYDIHTKQIDENYGFAVQPLITKFRNQSYLIQGQYQLPLYTGVCPEEIKAGTHSPLHLLKQKLQKGVIDTNNHLQLIARASLVDCKEQFMKCWFPEVEPSMLQFSIQNKADLVHYMLHAKHGKLENKVDKLEAQIGEDFEEIINQAKPFIK